MVTIQHLLLPKHLTPTPYAEIAIISLITVYYIDKLGTIVIYFRNKK